MLKILQTKFLKVIYQAFLQKSPVEAESGKIIATYKDEKQEDTGTTYNGFTLLDTCKILPCTHTHT